MRTCDVLIYWCIYVSLAIDGYGLSNISVLEAPFDLDDDLSPVQWQAITGNNNILMLTGQME